MLVCWISFTLAFLKLGFTFDYIRIRLPSIPFHFAFFCIQFSPSYSFLLSISTTILTVTFNKKSNYCWNSCPKWNCRTMVVRTNDRSSHHRTALTQKYHKYWNFPPKKENKTIKSKKIQVKKTHHKKWMEVIEASDWKKRIMHTHKHKHKHTLPISEHGSRAWVHQQILLASNKIYMRVSV